MRFWYLIICFIFLASPLLARYQDDYEEEDKSKEFEKEKKSDKEEKPSKKKRERETREKVELTPEELVNKAISSQYKNGQYFEACHSLWLLSKNIKDDRLNAKIFYFIGKSLIKLKLVYSSVPFFQKALSYNDENYYPKALNALFRISDYLKEDNYIYKTIQNISYNNLSSDQKAEVNFYLGKFLYQTGKYEESQNKLTQVFVGNQFFFKSRYFLGMILYNSGNQREALKYFREVAESKEIKEDDLDIQGLAFAGLGRVHYELAEFNDSINSFKQVPKFTPVWIESIFDSAWAYYMADNPQKALGAIHVLQSPYFEHLFRPEAYLLKVIIFYTYCWYNDALKSIEEFIEKYAKFYDFISQVKQIASNMDDEELFAQLSKKGNKEDSSNKFYKMLFSFLTTEKKFNKLQDQLQILDKETKIKENAPSFWREEFFPLIEKKLDKKISENKKELGSLIKLYLNDAENLLGDHLNQAKIIKLEILNSQKDQLEASLRVEGEKRAEKKIKKKSDLIEEGYEFWPFTGEYWSDELGFFIYNIMNICKVQKED